MSLIFFLKPVYRYLSAFVPTTSAPGADKKPQSPRKKRLVPDTLTLARDVQVRAKKEARSKQVHVDRKIVSLLDTSIEAISARLDRLFARLRAEERAAIEAQRESARRYKVMVDALARAELEHRIMLEKRRKRERDDEQAIMALANLGFI